MLRRFAHDIRLRVTPTSTLQSAPRLENQKGRLRARIVHVHDGDTVIICYVNSGRLRRRRCRLVGIDAPELSGPKMDRPAAEASRDYLRSVLRRNTVTIHYDGFDKYGRLLVRFRVKRGLWAADALLQSGHAVRMGPGGRKVA